MKDKKRTICLWPAVSGSIFVNLSLLFHEDLHMLTQIRLDQIHQYSDPGSQRVCSVHFPIVFHRGYHSNDMGTQVSNLYVTTPPPPPLLFKWPAMLHCKTCVFRLYNHWFQPSLEPDRSTCSISKQISSMGGSSFWDSPSDHSDMIHIYELVWLLPN